MKSTKHGLLVEFLDYLDANEHLKLPTADWDGAMQDFLFQRAIRPSQATATAGSPEDVRSAAVATWNAYALWTARPESTVAQNKLSERMSDLHDTLAISESQGESPLHLEPSPHRVLKVLTEAPTPSLPTPADLKRIEERADAWHEAWKKQNAAMMSEPGKATAVVTPAPLRCPDCAAIYLGRRLNEAGLAEWYCVHCQKVVSPAPQRFWRVKTDGPSWRAYQCNAAGEFQDYITHDDLTRDYPLTRELAERDGAASGLPQWKPTEGNQ